MAFQSFGEMSNGGSLPNCAAAPSSDRGGAEKMGSPLADGAHAIGSRNPRVVERGHAPAGSSQIPSWKRIFDLTLLLLTVPFWLLLMVLVTAWIKIVSPGPVFYRQERVGYRGKRFMIFKFRSMKVNVETESHERHLERLMQADCPMTKLDISGDPRLIRCARVLRAAGLDELPQILNVVRGEMSLVGPRPCTPHEFARYESWQQKRVNAPPGLTGYWQVNGKNKTTFSEMIAMDMFYANNMSFWLDLEIIFRTVPAVTVQVLESRADRRWEWWKRVVLRNPRRVQSLNESLDNL